MWGTRNNFAWYTNLHTLWRRITKFTWYRNISFTFPKCTFIRILYGIMTTDFRSSDVNIRWKVKLFFQIFTQDSWTHCTFFGTALLTEFRAAWLLIPTDIACSNGISGFGRGTLAEISLNTALFQRFALVIVIEISLRVMTSRPILNMYLVWSVWSRSEQRK